MVVGALCVAVGVLRSVVCRFAVCGYVFGDYRITRAVLSMAANTLYWETNQRNRQFSTRYHIQLTKPIDAHLATMGQFQ